MSGVRRGLHPDLSVRPRLLKCQILNGIRKISQSAARVEQPIVFLIFNPTLFVTPHHKVLTETLPSTISILNCHVANVANVTSV